MAEANKNIIANISRLKKFMDREGYAALIMRSGQNFTYLAGFAFPGTLGRHLDLSDSPRGPLIVWPREGDPVLILNNLLLQRLNKPLLLCVKLPQHARSAQNGRAFWSRRDTWRSCHR